MKKTSTSDYYFSYCPAAQWCDAMAKGGSSRMDMGCKCHRSTEFPRTKTLIVVLIPWACYRSRAMFKRRMQASFSARSGILCTVLYYIDKGGPLKSNTSPSTSLF
jgi:hypothetical protein